jgi:hypothetical protein
MSKYHSKKTVVDGMVFDSLKELRRYRVLKEMEKAGEISGLKRQVEFLLIPEQREPDTIGPRGGVHRGKLIERKISYIADYVYARGTELVVEDVKGYKGGGAYDVFTLKRKLMLHIHGIRVQEV